MKIRTCFVSNSSSSSFCIYGTYFEELSEKKLNGKIVKKLNELGFYLGSGPNDLGDGIYVGRNATSIEDNETGKEFKNSTLKELQECFPDKNITAENLSFIQEGWLDG